MSKWTKSARDQQCQVWLPGCLSPDTSTTVLAHIRRPWNAGVGVKPPDYMSCFACTNCHDLIDGRKRLDMTIDVSDERLRAALNRALILNTGVDGHLRTLRIWEGMGYL